MTERELLIKLHNFIVTKQIVQGDNASIKDMVIRYKSPPFTMAFPAALRMTMQDTHTLNDLLRLTEVLLASTEVTPLATPIVKLPPEPDDAPPT